MSTRICLVVALAFAGCSDSSSVSSEAADAESDGTIIGHHIVDQIEIEFSQTNPLTLTSQTGSIVGALNDGILTQSGIALSSLTHTETQEYATDLITLYDASNVQLDDIMDAYRVDFEATQAEAMLVEQINAGVELLRSTPPDQIDEEFMKLQIRMHATAQVMLDQLVGENDTEPMNTYLTTFTISVNASFQRAEVVFADID